MSPGTGPCPAAQRTQLRIRATPTRDQPTITLVKEEEPLQFRLRRLALESAVPSRLLIGQELDRYTPIIGPSPPARYR